MAKDLWLTLPVKDIKKTVQFFEAIGIGNKTEHGNTDFSAGFYIGEKKVVVMFFQENVFKGFLKGNITDTKTGNEMLISIGINSRAEIDELARKVEAAGGILFGKPSEIQGWMYGFGFIDPDGHKWNPLFMDMSKMPK